VRDARGGAMFGEANLRVRVEIASQGYERRDLLCNQCG
jgi:hypothetical protein